MPQYTIRYRCGDRHGRIALIVVDGRGDAFLFSEGRLQARLAGSDASARLASALGSGDACTPVPEVAPYTLDGLRYLTAPPEQRRRSIHVGGQRGIPAARLPQAMPQIGDA